MDTSSTRFVKRRAALSTVDTIVVVSDYAYVSGGNAQVGLSSAIELAARGLRVIVFAAVGPVDDALTRQPNLEVVCLGQSEAKSRGNLVAGALQGIWNDYARRRLDALLAELDPHRTIVHVHSWTKGLSSSVVRAADDAGYKIVVTLHDYFTVCPNGSYYVHPEQRPCTVRPMSFDCIRCDCDPRSYKQKLYRVGRQVVTDAIGGMPHRVRHYISISAHSRATIEPFLPQDAILYDVANPIDGVRLPRVRVADNDQYVYLGRLSKEKGPQFFLEAAARARVRATVIGDGPERDALRSANPQATFTGWLSPSDARARLRSARALVMPSLWEEPFGLVALEALSLGVPPIVPGASGARQHVVDGYTGLIFKRADGADLTSKLIALDDARLADNLGRVGYERYWRNPFSIERHVASLLGVYQQILAA